MLCFMLVVLLIREEAKEEKLPNYSVFSKSIQECEFVLCNKTIARFSDVWQAWKTGSKFKLQVKDIPWKNSITQVFNLKRPQYSWQDLFSI